MGQDIMVQDISGTGGLSAAQASLLQSLMATQTQENALVALGGDGTSTDPSSSSSTPTDFSSLLSSVLSMQSPSAATGITAVAPSAIGAQIAQTASSLANDLQGTMYRSFNPATTPQAASQVWSSSGWGNGNVQCVAFVDGAMRQAGVTLPFAGNASDFWQSYQNQPGWQTIANGAGLPQLGDIIALAGGSSGYGHVGIVTGVQPPMNGQPGSVTFAQSNSGSPRGTLPIATDGTVGAWPGYQVQGFIRSTL